MAPRNDVAAAIKNGNANSVVNELTDEEVRTMRKLKRDMERAQLALEASQVAHKAFLSDLVDKYELVDGDNIHQRTGIITRAG